MRRLDADHPGPGSDHRSGIPEWHCNDGFLSVGPVGPTAVIRGTSYYLKMGADPDSITLPRPVDRSRWHLIQPITMTGLALVLGAVNIGSHVGATLLAGLIIVPYLALTWAIRLRRGRVDRVRIRPALSLRSIPWAKVGGVRTPGRWEDLVEVEMLDGTSRATGFPMSYLDELVHLSGTDVLPRHSTPPALLPRTPVPMSRAQEQRNFVDRAARVKKRNAELLGDDKPSRGDTSGQRAVCPGSAGTPPNRSSSLGALSRTASSMLHSGRGAEATG